MATTYTTTLDVAIAHKDYAVRGGGEALAEELARMYDAPLYVGGNHGGVDLRYDDVRLIDATSRQRWAIRRGGVARSLAYMVAWQNEDRLTQYDTVITSGNEPLWYTPEPDQTVVAYCHSPPRELYDLNHNTGDGSIGALLRAVKRALYLPNVKAPDLWVTNGEEVARRVMQAWDISPEDIRVVYPPIDTRSLHPRNAETGDYYLSLGRLAHHKRTDFAVEACNRLDAPLTVAGRGPQQEALEELAGDTVDVVGFVPETEKQRLLAGAKALLMPAQNEDFGMVPVEALASGTPVIGVDEGMTGEQIVDGRNGLIAEASAEGFTAAIERYESEGVAWGSEQIREWATARFGVEHFHEGIRSAVAEAREWADKPSKLSGDEIDDAIEAVADGGER